ncbi:hypothetical protein [Aquincola tertiaricarbonis]|uniref:hypothetical protein n=1 Tax=Aquincola tertiaricarbonis TaxID=391953 RepID=UPI001E33063B|nr:hypothetical protein [Aquincola tertiaricarbonis]
MPDNVKATVKAFAGVNTTWLTRVLVATGLTHVASAERARAVHAAVAGAQRMALGRSDSARCDSLIEAHRKTGLLAV